jgi:1-acyl-sn-glycerol-3-phosphate acyltransferase
MTASISGRERVPAAPFRPRSPCGAACVDTTPPDARPLLRFVRYIALISVMLVTAAIAAPVRLVPAGPRRRRAASLILRYAARATLAMLGVRVDAPVRLPRERALVVANHVSWLDIVALLACDPGRRMRLVAKVEVAGWPVIGRLAKLVDTVFIDRNRPRGLPATVTDVRRALVAGDVVVVFAEGTTCCGVHRAPFRPAMFQAAVDAHVRVVPVTIRYADSRGAISTTAAFLGDETLVASLRRVVGRRRMRVGVRPGAVLHPTPGADRRRLAMVAQQAGGREVRPVPMVGATRPTATSTLTTVSA